VDHADATIARFGAALDEPRGLEIVDEADHLARRDADRASKIGLAQRAVGVEHAEHHALARFEPQRPQPRGPATRRLEAQLGQQEPDARGWKAPPGLLGQVVGHRAPA
jgi:hypothetical protein